MTNRIAFVLVALILALIALDLYMGMGGTLFMLKKFYALINIVIFWR
jgi:hypothetical protein